ncbi:hypothetical protein NOR_01881 [Metarhizium rileyi]|uniref:Uncharacterized protein n=1 Tax=Metarhizium rileyi (strain RCEF 4871) TaxID=1649241 RepID=A0A167I3J7_METRR|nr:hypothetical protein NOR_01881 [Metarhizium rileyi RCEF 4871]
MLKLQSQRRRGNIHKEQRRRAASSLHNITTDLQFVLPSKGQKRDRSYLPPPGFWDRLSEVPLTRNALLELNRRNELSPSSINHAQTHTPRHPLTLERYSRQGGPDLANLRGYEIPREVCENIASSQSNLPRRKRGSQSPVRRTSQSPSKTDATPDSTSTRNTGPYDRAFQQHLIDHDIFPDDYEYPDGTLPPEPGNMNDILDITTRPRRSLSPSRFSNDDFRNFKRADTHAFREREIITNIIPVIKGTVLDSKCVAGDVLFTNFDDLTDGTLVFGKPDVYYGARPEQLNIKVRREQSRKIMPSSQSDLPILPNFFLAAQAPNGSLAVASRQSCYNGALGARAMHSLQSYGQQEPEYDNKAYTISSIYHGGTLKMFTSHPIPPRTPGGKPGFVTTQIKTWGLTSDADTFRQGASAFRNARDWAKQQRDDAIRQANERAERFASSTSRRLDPRLVDEASGEDTITTTSQRIFQNLDSHSPASYHYSPNTSADELSMNPGGYPVAKRRKSRSQSPRKK